MAPSTHAPALERVLAAHREEAQRLRDAYGDPVAWMTSIVRESFDREVLDEVFQDLIEGRDEWNDDVLADITRR